VAPERASALNEDDAEETEAAHCHAQAAPRLTVRHNEYKADHFEKGSNDRDSDF
jgi:hypothetical protein